MTTSRRAGRHDDPGHGNDRSRGQLKPAPAPVASGNKDKSGGQPHRPPLTVQGSVPAAYEQPGSYEGALRELCNFCRWAAKDEQAQEGMDRLLRSFTRHILWPVGVLLAWLTVAIVLFEAMPQLSLTLKIITTSVTVASIGLGALRKRKPKKQRPNRCRREIVNDDLTDQPVPPGGNG